MVQGETVDWLDTALSLSHCSGMAGACLSQCTRQALLLLPLPCLRQ